MTRKSKGETTTKPESEPSGVEEFVVQEAPVIWESPKPPAKKKRKRQTTVKVKVTRGSLSFEGVTYEKGETFETTREKALSMNQNFIEIL